MSSLCPAMLAKLLAGERGGGRRRLFGFQDGGTPSASGLRYCSNTVGQGLFDELCRLFIDLWHDAGRFGTAAQAPVAERC